MTGPTKTHDIPMLLPPENRTDSSKLNDFLTCPRYYFYRHVLGWESEAPNNHLVFGTAWHLAMEHLLLHGYSAESVLAAHDLFEKEYRMHFSPETDDMFGGKTPLNAFIALGKYTEEYKRDFEEAKPLYTEIAGSVAVDAQRSLYFRQDSIMRREDNHHIFSREHKTGSRLWMWDDQWPLSIQVGTYSHVLYCLYPHDMVDGVEMNGVFFMKRKKDPIELHRFLVQKTKDQMQTWLDTVRFYLWEIEREFDLLCNICREDDPVLRAFSMNPTNCLKWGRICEYHDYCLAWPNPLRRAHEPPIGFKRDWWDPMAREAKKTFEFKGTDYEVEG